MAQGLDYSGSHPDLDCVVQQGIYSFVARYIGDADPNPLKYLDAPEKDQLRQRGLSIVTCRETTAGFMLTGSGAEHARASRAHLDALGMHDAVVFYALDVDYNVLTSAQKDAVDRFLRDAAATDGGGRFVGLYGDDEAIDHWVGTSYCHYGWQTYAWSHGRISSKAHFRQYLNGRAICGGTVDLNETYQDDFGQWPRPGEVVVPTLEDLMPFPVIAAPEIPGAIRPWTALLPGKVIRFVDWNPLPTSTPTEAWAPGQAYYSGVLSGYFTPVKNLTWEGDYDWAVAAAQQYSTLPASAICDVDEAAIAAAVVAALPPLNAPSDFSVSFTGAGTATPVAPT